jgi:2-polyprenyl-3-methyl-5-hydroxy-6-metoxy-1,4-benzoquinol methylase
VADLNEFTTEEKFDKIVLSNVLEHIDERVALLKKLKSLSHTILLRVPLISRDWLAVYKKEQGLEYKLDPTHKIEYREEELEKELKAAGWRVREKKINWGEWWGVIEQIN